jgi:hypothetical protein
MAVYIEKSRQRQHKDKDHMQKPVAFFYTVSEEIENIKKKKTDNKKES